MKNPIQTVARRAFAASLLTLSLLPAAWAQTVKANVASTHPPGSAADQALHKFKELTAERSGGRITIQIHPSSAMGDERQAFEQLSQGSVEFGATGMGPVSTFFPKFFIAEVPYLFNGQADFWKFWNGPGNDLFAMIDQKRNVRGMGVVYQGARYLTSNRPVRTVADVKGLKMRLPPIRSWQTVWSGLGAVPSTIAFAETYMALKTGIVEAQENPPETILNFKFYEAQKYLIATEHVQAGGLIWVSSAWWDKLPKADQALLAKAMAEGIAYGNEITREGDAKTVKKLQELGMQLVTVDKNEFRRATAPATSNMAKNDWDPAFYEKVKAALK